MLTWISVQNDSLSCETCIEGMSVRRQFLYIDKLTPDMNSSLLFVP